jgi:hypothetical protein
MQSSSSSLPLSPNTFSPFLADLGCCSLFHLLLREMELCNREKILATEQEQHQDSSSSTKTHATSYHVFEKHDRSRVEFFSFLGYILNSHRT